MFDRHLAWRRFWVQMAAVNISNGALHPIKIKHHGSSDVISRKLLPLSLIMSYGGSPKNAWQFVGYVAIPPSGVTKHHSKVLLVSQTRCYYQTTNKKQIIPYPQNRNKIIPIASNFPFTILWFVGPPCPPPFGCPCRPINCIQTTANFEKQHAPQLSYIVLQIIAEKNHQKKKIENHSRVSFHWNLPASRLLSGVKKRSGPAKQHQRSFAKAIPGVSRCANQGGWENHKWWLSHCQVTSG